MRYALKTHCKQILADVHTPVSIYLKIRDRYPHSILLESSDYHTSDNSFSYICFNPIASIIVENETITKTYPDDTVETIGLSEKKDLPHEIHTFIKQFRAENNSFKFVSNGLFGYMAYDAVRFFEPIKIQKKEKNPNIPDLYYTIYQNIIAIDHFKNEAYLFANCFNTKSNIPEIEQLLHIRDLATYNFTMEGETTSNLTDKQYITQINRAKQHCKRGDVFQLVLSRRFSQRFKGDEFNVYRALRSINPSPYLFYFDYGNFKIFGSSPETQLIIKENQAEIRPIAGTFPRTGNDIKDTELAKKLSEDQKENSEHVMLVDLARNDLSRNGSGVHIDTYREIQFFSHVIHLVSKVTAKKKANSTSMQVVADTFPAGTLSGAPKYNAMQLIDAYESVNRSFYGGAIGFMDFEGNFNHAIMIRTFLSKDHHLHYQAGAGLVFASDPEKELQETYTKLRALQKALQKAEHL